MFTRECSTLRSSPAGYLGKANDTLALRSACGLHRGDLEGSELHLYRRFDSCGPAAVLETVVARYKAA